MLVFFDITLTIVHIAWMIFNLTGWIWRSTRKVHLAILLLTAASWFILGIWFGLGYCPLTDWHWRLKHRLGETNLPNSFVKYLADRVTGRDIPSWLVDRVTLGCLISAVVAAIYVNFLRRHKTGLPARKD